VDPYADERTRELRQDLVFVADLPVGHQYQHAITLVG
jgi:hypothetical protein